MRRSIEALFLLCLSLLLAGCPRPLQPPATGGHAPAALPPADLRGAAVYSVVGRQSELSILVFRGGALSRLGHNHVISSLTLSGRAWLHPQFARSGFELALPVQELIVDDPQSRRAAGGEFPPDVPQQDKDGTRRNMLGPDVLDADRYQTIRLRSARVAGTPEAPDVVARITIKDVSRDVRVPMRLDVQGGRLTASGEFDVRQSDFGIAPYTAALGALAVQDRLHVRFKIVARREEHQENAREAAGPAG